MFKESENYLDSRQGNKVPGKKMQIPSDSIVYDNNPRTYV